MKKIIYRASISVVFLATAIVLLMYYGNCQWNKYVYLFQYKMGQDNSNDYLRHLEPGRNFSGAWRQWHTNGNLKRFAQYKDGKLNGVWKEFLEDGSPLFSIQFQNGIKDGECLFWSNGVLKCRGTYKNGKAFSGKIPICQNTNSPDTILKFLDMSYEYIDGHQVD